MLEKRRGLAVAIVVLRIASIGAVIFTLSGAASIISNLARGSARGDLQNALPSLIMILLFGAAAAALFFVLGEAAEILARLEKQGEDLRDWLEKMKSER